MEPTTTMRTGVVILHFRNWPAVLETIGDVINQSVDARVVVVDNGSEIPELEEAIRERFPNIDVLALPENLGYAGGMNAGVRCLGGEVDMILLITHECRMAPETLRLLADHLARFPDVAMVGPLLVSKRDALIDSAGGRLNQWMVPSHQLRHAPLSSAPADPEGVDWLDGAAIAIRADAWSSVGGLDESYFLYGEDVDLGIRVRRAGWRIEVVPGAIVREQSSGRRPGYWATREHVRRLVLHGTVVQRTRFLLISAAGLGRSLLAIARWASVGDKPRATAHRDQIRSTLVALADGLRGGPPRRRGWSPTENQGSCSP